jgi:hypothetical protein
VGDVLAVAVLVIAFVLAVERIASRVRRSRASGDADGAGSDAGTEDPDVPA